MLPCDQVQPVLRLQERSVFQDGKGSLLLRGEMRPEFRLLDIVKPELRGVLEARLRSSEVPRHL